MNYYDGKKKNEDEVGAFSIRNFFSFHNCKIIHMKREE